MRKSLVDFPKLKMLRVLVYLLKHKFHLNKKWNIPSYLWDTKIKIKIIFFPNFKSKNMCFSELIIPSYKKRELIENYICEKQVSITKEYV